MYIIFNFSIFVVQLKIRIWKLRIMEQKLKTQLIRIKIE